MTRLPVHNKHSSLSSGVPPVSYGRYTVFGPAPGAGRRRCGVKNRTWIRAALACMVIVGGLAGCASPVLTPDEPRSQYDRVDMVRGRRQPSYVFNQFGDRKPNIRGRLLNPE